MAPDGGHFVFPTEQLTDIPQDHNLFEECYARRITNGKEITGLAWDFNNEATLRLASSTRDGCVHLWSFNGKDLHSIWSIQFATTVPKTLGFTDKPGANIYVVSTYTGTWCVLFR
jgi:hypothetical protein